MSSALWDTDGGKELGIPLAGHVDVVEAAGFSPDSRLIGQER